MPSDPCPRCDEPLSHDGTFCRACGYDAELQAAHWRGDGIELPDDGDEDYADFLRREGLAGRARPPAGVAWVKLGAVVIVFALLLLALKGLR